MPLSTLFKALPVFFRYQFGRLSLRELHRAVFRSVLEGKPLSLFAGAVSSFLDRSLNRLLSPVVLRRFFEAKQRGERTFLLSSSPDFLVSAVAERLGFDSWRGTEYVVDKDGFLCDISSLIEGSAKLQWAMRSPFSREQITAYSDSEDDLPLLEWVKTAVVVNPSARLKRLAILRNWEVL